jgi:hypoxanthine phosphoribosyltransferase
VKKEFLTCEEQRNNAIKLAYTIYKNIGIPDIIYVLLRGGALLGNVVSEYFKLINKSKRPVYYAAVVARSYKDMCNKDKVKVDGWTYSPEHLRQGDLVLLIDDIFDTGTTINHLVTIITDHGIEAADIKIAVHDYKVRTYLQEQPPVQPDFYCRKHTFSSPEEDMWIHYMTHELQNLSTQELDVFDFKNDEDLKRAFNLLPCSVIKNIFISYN